MVGSGFLVRARRLHRSTSRSIAAQLHGHRDSTAVRDREKKIRGYARAGIPVYLLIDREEGEVIVYSEPSGDDYAKSPKRKLGLAVPLPEPLGFELDTGEF
ncbi:Uma2 family endonuclease [Streptomyces sp. GESEQ-4]|uniref:Uma2 family endonuclease n=1 Tax=Streptomyces sp. GESEQ-4 TaxID=2812655 RepID=UPI0027DD377D|nr:Uma2 family endonuclease [Streptomyces sp. GESEQ-4]